MNTRLRTRLLAFVSMIWLSSIGLPHSLCRAQVSRLMGDEYTYSATNLRGDIGETQDPVDETVFHVHDDPPVPLTFDGVPETVGGMTINERVVKWEGVEGGIPVVQDAGIDGQFEFDAISWEIPGEVVEFQFDTVDGGWISEDLLGQSFITLRELDWQNSDAGSEPFFHEDGWYIYYTNDGEAVTGYSTLLEDIGLLVGEHPFDPTVPEVFYIAYSRSQVEEVTEVFGSSVDLTFGTTQLDENDASWAALAEAMSVSDQIDPDGTDGINGLRIGFLVEPPSGEDIFIPGDVNLDGMFDVNDYDAMGAALRQGLTSSQFDVNEDGEVTRDDYYFLVEDIGNTYIGDSNNDGEFNSGDLVAAFTVGEYEDGIAMNSTWAEGDWNGSGDFDSGDFVDAFSRGGYEKGPRAAVAAVPEPSAVLLCLVGLASLCVRRRTSR